MNSVNDKFDLAIKNIEIFIEKKFDNLKNELELEYKNSKYKSSEYVDKNYHAISSLKKETLSFCFNFKKREKAFTFSGQWHRQ